MKYIHMSLEKDTKRADRVNALYYIYGWITNKLGYIVIRHKSYVRPAILKDGLAAGWEVTCMMVPMSKDSLKLWCEIRFIASFMII